MRREGVVPPPLGEPGEPPPPPRENFNLGVACRAEAGGCHRLILGALKSAFYIILIDSERRYP